MTVTSIYRDENEVVAARGGENLRLRLSGVDEEDIQAGFVICSRNCPVSPSRLPAFRICCGDCRGQGDHSSLRGQLR